MTTDPYGQYASPYLGMGNNPVNGIDPDGGLFSPPNPVYGKNGEGFLGCTASGMSGEAIIMDKDFFYEDMPDFMAWNLGTFYSQLEGIEHWNFMINGYEHWKSIGLPSPSMVYFNRGESQFTLTVNSTSGFTAGPVNLFSYGSMSINSKEGLNPFYYNDGLVSTGFSDVVNGFGFGVDLISEASGDIYFHTNIHGKSLYSVFSQAGHVRTFWAGIGGFKYMNVEGYDSASKMNLIWSADLWGYKGAVLGVGVDGNSVNWNVNKY